MLINKFYHNFLAYMHRVLLIKIEYIVSEIQIFAFYEIKESLTYQAIDLS